LDFVAEQLLVHLLIKQNNS